MTKTRGNFQFKAGNDQAHIKWRKKIKKVHVLSHSMSTTMHPFTGNTKTRQIDDSTKLGFMVYMMNWWWKKVGVSVKFESKNPPLWRDSLTNSDSCCHDNLPPLWCLHLSIHSFIQSILFAMYKCSAFHSWATE